MPDGSTLLCAGVAVLFLSLLRCFLHGATKAKKKLRGGDDEVMNSNPPAQGTDLSRNSAGRLENTSSHANSRAGLLIPELTVANGLLENKNQELVKALNETKGQLSRANEKLVGLQTQHEMLQREHVAMQQRHSQLEHSTKLEGTG